MARGRSLPRRGAGLYSRVLAVRGTQRRRRICPSVLSLDHGENEHGGVRLWGIAPRLRPAASAPMSGVDSEEGLIPDAR